MVGFNDPFKLLYQWKSLARKKNGNAFWCQRAPVYLKVMVKADAAAALINVVAYNNYFLPVGPCVDPSVDVVGL